MSGPSPWTDERDAQLTADWAAGFTTSQIGERMGIGKGSVIGRAHRLRLPSRGSPINLAASQSWTEADDAKLRQLYGGFLTAAEIGARMGRSVGQISYRAKFLGLVAGRRAKQTRPRQTSARRLQANARGLKSSYCPEHFAIIHAAPPAKSANNPPPAGWLKNRLAMRAHG